MQKKKKKSTKAIYSLIWFKTILQTKFKLKRKQEELESKAKNN